ncbi:MAG: hypothetical protein QXT81_05210 [Candidatus Bathyarchaeia archaeon]
MSSEKSLRFRIRRGDYEVELEGDFDYVSERFERLLESLPKAQAETKPTQRTISEFTESEADFAPSLKGIVELTPEGRPRLTVPVDTLKAKEALALLLYAAKPAAIDCEELSNLLSSSWKTMKPEAVRARASELRREGRLVAEDGRYSLSGAGVQWVEGEVLRRLRS